MGSTRRARGTRRAAAPARSAAGAPEGRAGILAAAIRQFSERGYEGTTTASVAREAAVTQPLVHHHFGSKEGLWRAAMDELFSGLPALAVPPDTPAGEQLVDAAERFVRFVAARPEATRVIAREGSCPSPRLDYLVERHLRAAFRGVVETVRAGQRAGLVAPALRPKLVLFLLLGAGSHLFDVTALAKASLGIDATDPRTRDEFVALLRTLLRHGVLRGAAPGAAARP